jgi:hypothetical protein
MYISWAASGIRYFSKPNAGSQNHISRVNIETEEGYQYWKNF